MCRRSPTTPRTPPLQKLRQIDPRRRERWQHTEEHTGQQSNYKKKDHDVEIQRRAAHPWNIAGIEPPSQRWSIPARGLPEPDRRYDGSVSLFCISAGNDLPAEPSVFHPRPQYGQSVADRLPEFCRRQNTWGKDEVGDTIAKGGTFRSLGDSGRFADGTSCSPTRPRT